jgi:hypothetical protein
MLKILHEMPMEPELAAYMEGLPRAVQDVATAEQMGERLQLGTKLGLWRSSVVRAIEFIQPEEMLYALAWNAHCITQNISGANKNYKDSHGTVFFSNTRFFCFVDPANQVEIPLENIYTVATHKGQYLDGISFRTQETDVQVTFPGTSDRKLFRDMVIYIAANAAMFPEHARGVTACKPQVCECPGCAATVIIHPNIINKCEYCGRYVEKQGG